MKILLVPWLLLLFGASLNSGHYIRDLEARERSSGVAYENPKPDKPTLREILYYHVIERPREEPVITARSFTNSHGYQFLEEPSSQEYDEKTRAEDDENDIEHTEESQEYNGKNEDTEIDEEEPETITEAKPLTDEDVKEAYKSRSYLFDQVRQRYAVKRMAVPDSLKRRRRQAEIQLPDAPRLSNKDTYVLPNTYGMNLNPQGGFVWNNLNKPNYYELGPSNGNSNEGQSQENLPQPSENILPPQTSDSGSSEDIYVNTNRPSAMPLETEAGKTNPEVFNDNPQPINDNSEPINENPESGRGMKSLEPILANDEAESNEGFANNPIGPEFYENSEPNYSVEPIANTQEAEPNAEAPIREEPAETFGQSNENPGSIPNEQPQLAESNENPVYGNDQSQPEELDKIPGYGYGQSERQERKPETSPEVSSQGEKIKEIPEAPTLPPLNYDNLPDYIRDAISSTEKPKTKQIDNPYINPQPSPDDKKVLEDKMEGMLATMQPVEDIPKTYGMNLTSDGGHVWNDMVNPPVSYDVGSPNNPEEGNKEEQTQAPTEQPEIREPENPIPEPAEPEIDQHITNPEEPNQEPDIHESEEDKPIEEPIPTEPENESEPEEPIADPNQGLPEPDTHESEEDKPIEEPIPKEPEIESEPEEPTVDPNQGLPEPNNEPEPPVPDSEGNPIEAQPEPLEPKPTEETENPEFIPDPGTEDNHEIEVPEQPGIEEPSEESTKHIEEPDNEPVEEVTEEENNKPDIMTELLKSEQFWKWLGEWTATYMELLEKHMRKIAIQEICKREKAGEQMCLIEDNPEGTGIIVKDGKIIVDGKEIEMTHTDNLDGELKGHYNNRHDNKGTNGNKVEASTIYGNSIGNDKVTNVFIFTADKAEEVIDQLKPDNGSEVNFVIDDRIKEENKDEPNKEKSIEDESNVEDTNIDDINTESNEGVINKEESNKSESNEQEVPNDDNKDSIEVVTNEESNIELNNEEPNKESIDDFSKEESNKNEQNTDLKPEVESGDLNKDKEPGADATEVNNYRENDKPKGTSGDIGEIDDEANDEPKLDSSEKDIGSSKEYLEKK